MRKKRVIVVRHGEAEHNVDPNALQRRDTSLTSLGHEQAKGLRALLEPFAPVAVVTSPTLRTLQTAVGMLPANAAWRVIVV